MNNKFKDSLKTKPVRDIKEETIDDLFKFLEQQVRKTSEDKTLTREQVADKGDVLLNTMKFLQNYRENIQVLDKHCRKGKIR